MNEADLARLQLARRAFKAAAPSDVEVQVAVRRARLALLRSRKTRSLAGKSLVVLVLAIGGLAYAKPQAVGDLLGSAPAESPGSTQAIGRSREPVAPPAALAQQANAAQAVQGAPAVQPTPQAAAPAGAAVVASPAQGASPAQSAAAKSAAPGRAAKPAVTASEWGNVASALARGDEGSALASLGNLSQSEDPRTRDKADLGRAQLLLSRGERDSACALGRALLERTIDAHLERQARALLNDCTR